MYNSVFFQAAFAFLQMVAYTMTEQLQSDLKGGTTTFQSQVLEVKKEIAGNAPSLLNSNTTKQDGICSFDLGGKLEVGRAFVFNKVAIGYAFHATLTGQEGKLAYTVQAPAELQNSLVVVEQNGR